MDVAPYQARHGPCCFARFRAGHVGGSAFSWNDTEVGGPDGWQYGQEDDKHALIGHPLSAAVNQELRDRLEEVTVQRLQLTP